MDLTFHFPTEDNITNYLTQHPLLDNNSLSYLNENKIIKIVSKVFSNQEKKEWDVDDSVRTIFLRKSHLPYLIALTLIVNVAKALKDCAQNKNLDELNEAYKTKQTKIAKL